MLNPLNKLNKPSLTAFIAVLLLATAATAGSLTPSASPGSTMNTLAEIYDSITTGFDSSAVTASSSGSLIQHLKFIESNLFSLSSDSLDFDELVDAMTLDADTSIASGGFNTTWNGDFYHLQGNLGIGTTAPSRDLEISRSGTSDIGIVSSDGIAQLLLNAFTDSDARVVFQENGDNRWFIGNDGDDNNKFKIAINGGFATTWVTVEQLGNVGIGTTTPDSKLEVNGGGNNVDIVASTSGALAFVRTRSNGVNGFTAHSYRNSALDHVEIIGHAARGTIDTPLPLQDGDQIIAFLGRVGTSSFSTDDVAMKFAAAGNVTTDSHPTRIGFLTTPVGSTTLTERMRIDSDGNIGIGTTVPARLLTTRAAIPTADSIGNFSPLIRLSQSTGSATAKAAVEFYSENDSYTMALLGSEPGSAFDAPKFFISTSDTAHAIQDRLVIDAFGNVGIGTTAPIARLDIEPESSFSGPLFRVASGSSERFRITSAGNVGIGTLTPAGTLDIANASESTLLLTRDDTSVNSNDLIGRIDFANNDATLTANRTYARIEARSTTIVTNDAAEGYLSFFTTPSTIGGAPLERMRINSEGAVGIGTTTPVFELTVASSGEGNIMRLQDSDGTCDLDPDSGGLTTSCSSDRSLKSNIQDASSSLGFLSTFTIREYTVNASGNRTIGVIAQEVQQINPELVTENSNGILMVRQPSIWHLVNGIQELNDRIDALGGELLLEQEHGTEGGFFSAILTAFRELLGIEFEQGRIKTETVELKQGATIQDRMTGEPYCVTVENGLITTIPGNCADIAPTSSSSAPPAQSSSSSDTYGSLTIIKEVIGGQQVARDFSFHIIGGLLNESQQFGDDDDDTDALGGVHQYSQIQTGTYIITEVDSLGYEESYSVNGDEGNSTSCVVTITEGGSATCTITNMYNATKYPDETPTPTADTTPPTISLNGSAETTLTEGDTYTDPGATAQDDVDGDLTSAIQVTGSVDTTIPATYTLTYSVSDLAGNKATATRTVAVIEQTTTPQIVVDPDPGSVASTSAQ